MGSSPITFGSTAPQCALAAVSTATAPGRRRAPQRICSAVAASASQSLARSRIDQRTNGRLMRSETLSFSALPTPCAASKWQQRSCGGDQAESAGARDQPRSILDDIRGEGIISIRKIAEDLSAVASSPHAAVSGNRLQLSGYSKLVCRSRGLDDRSLGHARAAQCS